MTKKNDILYSIATTSTGQMVNANDAEKGIDYTCPLCKQPFILRKGKRKRPHFSHKNLSLNCTPETALHYSFKNLLAKKIQNHIDNKKVLAIKWKCEQCHEYHSGNLLKKAVQVETEYDLGNCKPDIALLGQNNRPVAVIEIIVTHAPEQQALDFYKNKKIAVVPFTLESDKDIHRLQDPILESDSLNLCKNSKCPKCGNYMTKRRLLIVNAKCGNCKAPIKLAALEAEYIGIGELSQSEFEFATKKGCYLRPRCIRGTNHRYFVNSCRSCNDSIDTIADIMYEVSCYRNNNPQEFDTGFTCSQCI